MTTRRDFIKYTSVFTAVLPAMAGAGIASVDNEDNVKIVVRDIRFDLSREFSRELGLSNCYVLDVDEDVSSAYLELRELLKVRRISQLSGVTSDSAKSILESLLLDPSISYLYEHRVKEAVNVSGVDLVAWSYSS